MTRCRHRDKDLLANWFSVLQTLPLAEPHQGDEAEPLHGAHGQDQPQPVQSGQEPQLKEGQREDIVDVAPFLDGRQEGGGPVTRSRARIRMSERCQR